MRLENYLCNLITESINDKGIFKSIWLVGAPGSGKSYTLDKIKLGTIEIKMINIDRFIEYFGKEDPMILVGSSPKHIRSKSQKLTKNQLYLHVNSMLPLAIDGTGAELHTFTRRIGILESLGYDTAAVFINTSLDLALERNAKRQRQVDPQMIIDMFNKIEKNKTVYRAKFGTYIEIENNGVSLDNKVIEHACKVMANYFNSPVSNPTGQEIIEAMKAKGYKYLSEYMREDYIRKVVDAWYISR